MIQMPESLESSPMASVMSGDGLASQSGTPLTAEDLAEVMTMCTRVTEHLHSAHQVLQAEVRRLNQELRETNEQLRRAHHLAALGQMAAGIAHEVRNPLGSIRLYASMLNEDLSDRPESQALARQISTAVRDLDHVVGDVLDFSRELKLDPRPIPAGDLVAHAADACGVLFHETGINLNIDESNDPMLLCDPGSMGQALTNIIRNAAQAIESTQSRGVVNVIVEEVFRSLPGEDAQSWSCITVSDDGPGISDEVRDRIFNPFFTTRAAGTGLGLAIVHRIVDAHGGSIEIDANVPRGTVVRLLLPPHTDTPPAPESVSLLESAL